jgi:phage FluMu protein Com
MQEPKHKQPERELRCSNCGRKLCDLEGVFVYAARCPECAKVARFYRAKDIEPRRAV